MQKTKKLQQPGIHRVQAKGILGFGAAGHKVALRLEREKKIWHKAHCLPLPSQTHTRPALNVTE